MAEHELKVKLIAEVDESSFSKAKSRASSAGGGGGGRGGGYGSAGKLPPVIAQAEAGLNRARMAASKDMANFQKNMSFLMMPMLRPSSPWGLVAASRQAYAAFTTTKTGQAMTGGSLGKAGLYTAGLTGAAVGVGVALQGLKIAVSDTINAFERAKNLYSNALTSGGLNLGFVTRRSLAAKTLGVSERDVLQFGHAISVINPKLEWASGILAKTAPNLMAVNVEWKALLISIQALAAEVANQLAPALIALFDGMRQFVQWIDKAASTLNEAVVNAAEAEGGTSGTAEGTDKSYAAEKKKSKEGLFPQPIAYMNQMRASAWERMGLVIGGMGAANPAKETAHNTKRTVEEIRRLANHLMRGNSKPIFTTAQSHQ